MITFPLNLASDYLIMLMCFVLIGLIRFFYHITTWTYSMITSTESESLIFSRPTLNKPVW